MMKIVKLANALVCVVALYLCWLTLPDFSGWSFGYIYAVLQRLAILTALFYLCRHYSLISSLSDGAQSCRAFMRMVFSLCKVLLKKLVQADISVIRNLTSIACEANFKDIRQITKTKTPYHGYAWAAWATLTNLCLVILLSIFCDQYHSWLGVLGVMIWLIFSMQLLSVILAYESVSFVVLFTMLFLTIPFAIGTFLDNLFGAPPLFSNTPWLVSPVATLPVSYRQSITLTPLTVAIIGLFCLLALFYAQACMSIHEAVLALNERNNSQPTPKGNIAAPVRETKLPYIQPPEDPDSFGVALNTLIGERHCRAKRARRYPKQH